MGTRGPLTGYLLAGEELALHGAAAGRLEEVTGRWRRRWYHDFMGTRPGSREECADTAWIAPIAAIDPARAAVAPRHLERPRGEEIAGKLTLGETRAELRAFRLAEVCDRVPSLTFKRPWTRTPMRTFRQALADSAVVTIEAAGPITFELARFPAGGGGGPAPAPAPAPGPRTMTVAPKEGGRQVDLLLGNLSPLEERAPCGDDYVPMPALHFELYYRLAAVPPPPWPWGLPLPHPGFRDVDAARVREPWPAILEAVGRRRGGGEGTIERPICALARFRVE